MTDFHLPKSRQSLQQEPQAKPGLKKKARPTVDCPKPGPEIKLRYVAKNGQHKHEQMVIMTVQSLQLAQNSGCQLLADTKKTSFDGFLLCFVSLGDLRNWVLHREVFLTW